MRVCFFTLLLFVSQFCFGQNLPPCDPSGDNLLLNDNPPGCFMCDFVHTGDTDGYTADTGFDFPCGTIQNNQWLLIRTDDDGKIDISIGVASCESLQGLEVAIYDLEMNLVSDCFVIDHAEIGEILVEDLTPQTEYQLMVDGIDGDVCRFIVTLRGSAVHLPMRIQKLYQEPDYCELRLGAALLFYVDPVEFASIYNWELPSMFERVSGGGANDTFVLVRIVDFGGGTLLVTSENECYAGVPYVEPFVVLPNSNIFTADLIGTICKDECFQFQDSCYSEAGFHGIVTADVGVDDCDSVFILELIDLRFIASPFVNCEPQTNGVLINWSSAFSASEYVVSVNNDSITTVVDSSFFLETSQFDSTLFIKIQPKGTCDYLPGEVQCDNPVSNLKDDFLNNKISVYPNPTTGNLNIETDLIIQEIEIYDVTGRFLQKEKMKTFDLKNQESGIYFLKIKTNEGVGFNRVILN